MDMAFDALRHISILVLGAGGGVHDLRMDGGLPPGFLKAQIQKDSHWIGVITNQ